MASLIPRLWVSLALIGAVSLTNAAIAKATSQVLRRDTVAWVVYVDDLHINFVNTGRLRKLVQALLTDVVQEGDAVAIVTPGPSEVITEFTTNRELARLVAKLTGSGLRPFEIASTEVSIVHELRFRARVSLSRATAAVALLGQVEAQQRGLIYVSNGYPVDVTDFIESRALAHVARQNGVKIIAIDARSLDTSARPPDPVDPTWDAHMKATRSLQQLGEQSGGFAILDGSDMRAAFKRIITAVTSKPPGD